MSTGDPSAAGGDWGEWARLMVENQIRRRGLDDARVLDAMLAVPRHVFVPGMSMSKAYSDQALPTALGQTISQPYIVALMTSLLDVTPGCKVLEVGTGSGYQAAILAYLGAYVVTMERLPPLAVAAEQLIRSAEPQVRSNDPTLQTTGVVARIKVVVGDGSLGCSGEAPFDRILVTAAAPRLPVAFTDQTQPSEHARPHCASAARVVIPIGDRSEQTLCTFVRTSDGWLRKDGVGCRFVPLIGADAFAPE